MPRSRAKASRTPARTVRARSSGQGFAIHSSSASWMASLQVAGGVAITEGAFVPSGPGSFASFGCSVLFLRNYLLHNKLHTTKVF